MAWTPGDLAADITSIAAAIELGIPDRIEAERDVATINAQLRAATLKQSRLEVLVAISAGVSIGFGPYSNGRQIGLFVDDLMDRIAIELSPDFWKAYAAVPALVAAIRAEVETARADSPAVTTRVR